MIETSDRQVEFVGELPVETTEIMEKDAGIQDINTNLEQSNYNEVMSYYRSNLRKSEVE